jgi:CAAX prenyl protease-like protein
MPQEDSSAPSSAALWRYVAPFGLFILLQSLPALLRQAPHPGGATPFWLAVPEFWVYPLQTILCAAVLIWFRSAYPRWINISGFFVGLAVGILVFAEWISPQLLFHAAPRIAGGFNPHQLPPAAGDTAFLYATVVGMRFVRLALVVPVLEEVFWRGFLLRYLVRDDFTGVPFGTFTPIAFGVVVAGFTIEHSAPDWPVALVAGALYNFVAIRTRSLPACVLAHAATNLLLGIYIMRTGQWGFW